jgi:hypothetical protein
MIPENVSPALFGKAAPRDLESAIARVVELISVTEGNFNERFVGCVFNSVEEITKAFKECQFFVTPFKKPIKNEHSVTEWLHLVSKVDGSEYDLLVNTMGLSTILNAIKTGDAKA